MLGKSLISKALHTALLGIAVATLLLPLPGRCAACITGSQHCSQCLDTGTENTPSSPACCQHHSSATHAQAAATQANPAPSHDIPCGCTVRYLPRTTPVEKTGTTVEHSPIATLPASIAILALQPDLHTDAILSPAALTAAIPHRILHCSWII